MRSNDERDVEASTSAHGRTQPLDVVIFSAAFPPAYLHGGPVRSLAGLVDSLGEEIRFRVITWAYDGQRGRSLRDVHPDRWTRWGHTDVWYSSRSYGVSIRLLRTIARAKPDVIMLNSLFDWRFGSLPLLASRVWRRRHSVILAPRGELAPGALAIKPLKKRLFLVAFRVLRLDRWVVWQASSILEASDVRRTFGARRVAVVGEPRPDLARQAGAESLNPIPFGSNRLVFFSRIAPVKNLLCLIAALQEVSHEIDFTIAGPVENPQYWQECLALVAELPGHVVVHVHGPVEPNSVVQFLSQFDLLVLPSFGENFGHVVLESLTAGTPVIVGQDTPWKLLEQRGAGWLCDPASPSSLTELLDSFFALLPSDRARVARSAREVARDICQSAEAIGAQRQLLLSIAAHAPAGAVAPSEGSLPRDDRV